MAKSKPLTYVLIIILILVGIYWAYTMMTKNSMPAGGVSIENGGMNMELLETDSLLTDKFIQVLKNIDQVTLKDRSLLTNPIFQTKLQDYGKPLTPRLQGRDNPFAPLGSGSGLGMVEPTPNLPENSSETSGD